MAQPVSWHMAVADAATGMSSGLLGFLGITVSLLLYLFAPSVTVPAWTAAIAILFLAALIFIVIQALRDEVSGSRNRLPQLLAVICNRDVDEFPVLLLEPSELFGVGSLVSIYFKDNSTEFEFLVGYGSVLTVQTDRKVQVKVEQWVPGSGDIPQKIENQSSDAMKGTIVRPGVPRSAIGQFDQSLAFLKALAVERLDANDTNEVEE